MREGCLYCRPSKLRRICVAKKQKTPKAREKIEKCIVKKQKSAKVGEKSGKDKSNAQPIHPKYHRANICRPSKLQSIHSK